FMWIKSDRWGTTNWGKLVQATNNLALLPDLSGTIIEANGVVFDGGGMFIRPTGAKNSNDMIPVSTTITPATVTVPPAGGGFPTIVGASGTFPVKGAVVTVAPSDFKWNSVLNCLSGGGGDGADCPTGLDGNGFRYDSPTWYGFSVSGGYYEDDEWDAAVKWAGDWDNLKWSFAYGFPRVNAEGWPLWDVPYGCCCRGCGGDGG